MSPIEKVLTIGGKDFASFKIKERGDIFLFLLPWRPELHLTIHAGLADAARGPSLKTLKRIMPYYVHLAYNRGRKGKFHLPHSWKEVGNALLSRMGLWNEEWGEEEFLLFPGIGTIMQGFKEEGDKVIVRPDLLGNLIKELRVVGGIEFEKAKPGGAIRKRKGAVHPFIGSIILIGDVFPLVVKDLKDVPTLQLEDNEQAILSEATEGMEEWIDERIKIIENIAESVYEFIPDEVWDYLKRLRRRELEGVSLPPPKELPFL